MSPIIKHVAQMLENIVGNVQELRKRSLEIPLQFFVGIDQVKIFLIKLLGDGLEVGGGFRGDLAHGEGLFE